MPYCIDPALFARATEICHRHGKTRESLMITSLTSVLAQGVDDVISAF